MTMPYTEQNYKRGLFKTGGIATIVAAGAAAAQTLWTMSAGRTARIRKLHIFNGQGAPVQITIGMAIPVVASIPLIMAVNGVDLHLIEEDLPNVEYTANITVAASAAGAGALAVTVQAEVEEFQGPTG